MIGASDLLQKQMIQYCDFAVARSGAHDGVDLARRLVAKLRAENVIGRDNIFQRRKNHLHRSGRQNIEIELMAIDAGIEELVEQFDVALEANALAHLAQMFLPHFGFEFRIMQQQIRQFRALLYQVDLGHALGFALEFLGGNPNQFGEHVARIIEGERLVEVAGENVAFQELVCHIAIRFASGPGAP